MDYAYEMIGCTYFYGGTGPCNAPGYDCSGLMMEAWASAGVSIPRVSYDQMGSLPPVSLHTASGAFTTANLSRATSSASPATRTSECTSAAAI